MNEYCTYSELKEYLLPEGTTITDEEDELLRMFCELASRMMDGHCRRHFYPLSQARSYDLQADTTRLLLDEDLLEVTTFTTRNGGVTISSGDYYPMCGDLYDLTPYDRLVMKSDGTQVLLEYSGTIQKANAVTGIWGYHEDWSGAWQSANDTVQDDPLSSSATSLTVTDIDGADIYGMDPRIRVQHLLKIESEYLYVTAVNTTTNVATVRRGVNGTTAAEHASGTAISVFLPQRQIHLATKRLAKWLYQQRSSTNSAEVATVDASGTTRLPPTAPADVLMIANKYTRRDYH